MSNLFNFTRILAENCSPEIVNTYSKQTFLSSGLNTLKESNSDIMDITRCLYYSILEAESKQDENEKFAEFFKEYKNAINKYILKAQELASQFTINIENFADANKDILDSQDNANIMDTQTYKGVQYDNLLNDEVPEMEPYKIFKKEFAFIGKLFQDLGPIGTEEEKAQIIATVCNNLSSEISDGWLDKCIEKLTGCEKCTKDSFAKTIYSRFVKNPSCDMEVDIGCVKQAKLDIMNYINYINVINKSVTEFCDGLEKVADEVGSMFFRNQDNKLPIKTDEDGVEDKTYRMNSYSFNQMNIFISTKISQINEICNLYLIAISIKMDCIVKYLQQCKDIINTAASGVDNTPNTEIDPGDNDDDNNNVVDSDDIDDPELQDYYINNEPDSDSEEDKTVIEKDESEQEIEQEFYLFEAELFQKTRSIEDMIMKQSLLESITEDVAGGNTAANINEKKKSVQAIIQNIAQQITNMVQKFVSSFTKNYEYQINFIQKNKEKIMSAKIPDKWTIQKIDIKVLDQFNLVPFLEGDAELLKDKSKYLSQKYGSILAPSDGNESAKDRLMKKIYQENESKYTNTDRNEGFTFVTAGYKKAIANLEKARNSLDKTVTSTKNIVAKENSLEGTMLTYFSEDTSDVKDVEKEDSKSDSVKQYFSISSEVIVAVMNAYNMAMKKHIVFLQKLAQIKGAKIEPNPNKETDNNS
jgi:hypothetical protein